MITGTEHEEEFLRQMISKIKNHYSKEDSKEELMLRTLTSTSKNKSSSLDELKQIIESQLKQNIAQKVRRPKSALKSPSKDNRDISPESNHNYSRNVRMS